MPQAGRERPASTTYESDALSAGILASLLVFALQVLVPDPTAVLPMLYVFVVVLVLAVRPGVPRVGFCIVLVLLLVLASILKAPFGGFEEFPQAVLLPSAMIILLNRYWPRRFVQAPPPGTQQDPVLVGTTPKAAAEELFRRVYDSSQIGMALLGQDRRILGMNVRFGQVLCFSEPELRGQRMRSVVHPDDIDAVEGVLDKLFETGIPSLQRVVRCVRKDCKIVFLNLSVSVARDEHGAIQFALITADDVTEHRNVEERLRLRESEFAHASRVAAVGEMATGLAHEINQPLAAITNYAEASMLRVRHSGPEPEAIISDLEDIAAQAERASEIIRRLRGFLRKRESNRGQANINDIIREVLEFTQFETRSRQIRVATELSELPILAVDRVQIQQVLVNLIRNAVEAMNETPIEQRELRITSALGRQAVTVAVIDQGRGLPRGVSERLFRPFFSTKPEGLGVGLSISRTIVEAHNGRLWAESNPGQGTVFYFTLPARNTVSENDPEQPQNLVESHLGAD